jgi:hypothetical protein
MEELELKSRKEGKRSIPRNAVLYFERLNRFNQWRKLVGVEIGIKEGKPGNIVEKRKHEEERIKEKYLRFLDTNLFILLGKKNYNEFINYFRVDSYRNFLENLNENLPPMSENCRVVVILPSRLEGKNILRVLEGYLNQVDDKNNPLNKDLFEIIILINRRESESDDDTEEKINGFCQQYPELRIRAIKVIFPQNEAISNVGMCRKIISDLAILRSKDHTKPLYFITEDADTIFVDPQIVFQTIKNFDSKYPLDALKGQERRDPHILKEIPFLLFKLQLDAALPILLKQGRKDLGRGLEFIDNEIFRWRRVITGGWATAFTSEILMKIGGYLPVKMGEDMSIGELISLLRGKEIETKEFGKIIQPDNSTVDFFPVKSIGSARRYVAELLQRIKTAYSSEFGTENEVKTLREFDIDEALKEIKEKKLNEINEETLKMIENDLSWKRLFLISVLGKEKGERLFERLMIIVLGFKKEDYKIEDNQVKILNIKKLKAIFYTFRLRLWIGQRLKNDRKTEVFGLPIMPISQAIEKLRNLEEKLK